MRVNYDFGYSIQSPTKKLDMMNAGQWAEFYNLQAKNDNVAPYFTQAQVDSLKGVTGTNWQDLVLDDNAPLFSHNITVSGGSDKTRYSVSVAYSNRMELSATVLLTVIPCVQISKVISVAK